MDQSDLLAGYQKLLAENESLKGEISGLKARLDILDPRIVSDVNPPPVSLLEPSPVNTTNEVALEYHPFCKI